MRKQKGFNPLEIKIPALQSGRLPERHGETDIRKRHRSFLTGPVRKKFTNGAGFTPLEISRIQKVQEFRTAFLTGFTLIELLVVIAIIALLLAILMPSLQRVKKQAQAVACMSNIKQWSYCWHMYLEDSGGKFPSGAGASGDWPENLRPYYKDRGALTLCPSAKKPYTEGGKVPFGAWRWRLEGGGWTDFESKPGDDYGSYGMDEWLGDRPEDNYWKTREQKKANNIPMFFDCVFIDTWPSHTQGPPEVDGNVILPNEMHLVCLNRHKGAINAVFLDLNVRKVGLKELWTFNWHRNFDIQGVWTTAGGVQSSDWPQWMRKFKDY